MSATASATSPGIAGLLMDVYGHSALIAGRPRTFVGVDELNQPELFIRTLWVRAWRGPRIPCIACRLVTSLDEGAFGSGD